MYKLIHWYNQNKKIFWKVIGIIVTVIVVIQLINGVASKSNQINLQNTTTIQQNTTNDNLNQITLKDDKSVLTGSSLSEAQTKKLDVLDQFVEHCNNGQIDEAYKLISDDCKKVMFKTKADFERIYYNKIFSGEAKNISVENWVRNIYKVKFTQDALSTGVYNENGAIQDYITIIEDDEKNIKLNINGYIGKEEINQSKEAFDVKINVVNRHQYMDYEIYEFEVTNNSKNSIIMNDIENTDSIYLEDENGIKYYAYMHELSSADLRLFPGETKKITIKYYSKYSSSKKIEKVVFSEIQLGGNEYASFEIKSN